MIRIFDLTHSEQDTLDQLLKQLDAKKPRNELRAAYYDGKNAVRDLGISMPPMMQQVATVLGWPAKAVDLLNNRCNLDGFVLAGGSADDLGIPELMVANRLDVEARQAGTSALKHSLAFLAATLGDKESGEPPVVITTRSALFGTGLWDKRKRALSAFLSVIDCNEQGEPIEMVMYHPRGHVEMTKKAGKWNVVRREHGLGRVPVEMLTFKSDVDNPYGTSRISRAIMSYTNQGIRATLRSEVNAEFYGSPQRYLMGANESAFQDAAGNLKTQWQAIVGRIWAIDSDEDGNTPTVGQFPQMSQQPHIEQLRWIASAFAGEASIPASSLGITTDANPASAEAYHASREDLIQLAENATDEWSPAWCRTMATAIQLRDGLDEVPPELLAGLRAKWRNPATPSRAAAADAGLKTIQAFPWIAETEVGLEMMGFDQTMIDRLLAEKRRLGGSAALRAIAEAAAAGRPVVAGGIADAG